ncbi:MAG TPA: molybdopterin molybdotransferase MoeA, partial [Novosphingobium sp.]|nr:molybdopterin molybdotransferase MoeA [Novosphingobium sp.]
IRRAGMDFREGGPLLDAGTRLGPAQIALAIAGGHRCVAVRRRPVLAVLDSGDELAIDGQDCLPHQIPASNGAMLAALCAPLAARILPLGPVADRMEALASALAGAEEADVVVTSGGASVGDHDLIRPALEAWGAQIDFWRVAIKPGKPLLIARRGHQLIVGLPGNPVSSFVTAFHFLLPLPAAAGGAATPLPRRIAARLAEPLGPVGARREFLRAVWDGREIRALALQDSGALSSLAAANALIDRPARAAPAAPSDEVLAYLIGNGGIA